MLTTWFNLSPYSAAVIVHVVAATGLLGSTLFSPLIRRALLRAASLEMLRAWLDFGRRASRSNPVMALVVLASGMYLGSFGWWTDGWFALTVAAWLVNAALAARVVKPSAMALGVAAGRAGSGPVPPHVDALRRSRRWAIAEAVMRGSDITMIYLMVAKPPLAGACTAVALAIAMSVAIERLSADPAPRHASAVALANGAAPAR